MTRETHHPLDPEEGPTVWADTDVGNKHTVGILIGTDPEEPRKEFVLSHDEVWRLNTIIQLED